MAASFARTCPRNESTDESAAGGCARLHRASLLAGAERRRPAAVWRVGSRGRLDLLGSRRGNVQYHSSAPLGVAVDVCEGALRFTHVAVDEAGGWDWTSATSCSIVNPMLAGSRQTMSCQRYW